MPTPCQPHANPMSTPCQPHANPMPTPCGPMLTPCGPMLTPCGPMPTPCGPMPTPCDPIRRGFPPGPQRAGGGGGGAGSAWGCFICQLSRWFYVLHNARERVGYTCAASSVPNQLLLKIPELQSRASGSRPSNQGPWFLVCRHFARRWSGVPKFW
jgi:hypothetical protein